MKILIGYDGSEHSDQAIEDLRLAGLPDDCEATVVSVADLLMSSPELSEVLGQGLASMGVAAKLEQAKTFAERMTNDAKNAGERAAQNVRDIFPGWKVREETLTGTPPWVLIDAAQSWNADLIVVGSQGHSALKRFFIGSVSKKVVTDAHCSVRVVRPRLRERNTSDRPRLMIGVDGSPAAEQAIYSVGQRVWPSGTEVQLVTVDDSTPPASIVSRLPQAASMINDYFRQRETRVNSMVQWAIQELNNIGLVTSVVAEKGDAKTILLEKAEAWNADCIFVGTRDFKSGFERFRLGSVSTTVVTNAPCTVEVVRPSEQI